MSTTAQVIVGLLLLLTGLVSVIAAILGNPIRLGGKEIPGPDSGPARGIVAGIGSAALAGCAMLFILGGTHGKPTASSDFAAPSPTPNAAQVLVQTGGISGTVGGLPALTPTPTPTGSPKPPAAPSTAAVKPGQPTVTSIKVTAGAESSCNQTYHASITVANGPVALKYVISVGGFVVGPNPRTATVSGSTANLDDYQVNVEHPGEIVYNVLSPNLVSDLKAWTVPAACLPALNIAAPYISAGPGSGDPCNGAKLDFLAKLTIAAPPGGTNVTYHAVVNNVARGPHTEYFPQGTYLVGESVVLPDDPNSFSVTVTYVITSPVQDSAQATLSGPCYSPPPPPPPPPPPTTDPTTEAPPTTDPPTSDPAAVQSALASPSAVELTIAPV